MARGNGWFSFSSARATPVFGSPSWTCFELSRSAHRRQSGRLSSRFSACCRLNTSGESSDFHGLTDQGAWNNIVITMRAVHVSIRRIGNSQGVVIPKPLLAQLGLDAEAGGGMTI